MTERAIDRRAAEGEIAYWNYRAIRDVRTCQLTGETEAFIQFHEVHYETTNGVYDDRTITAWAEAPAVPYGETAEDLQAVLKRMQEALEKPVLNRADLDAFFGDTDSNAENT